MLRLFASPKMTAVFCASLILSPQFSVVSSQQKKQSRLF
jgi:hypothetical protein